MTAPEPIAWRVSVARANRYAEFTHWQTPASQNFTSKAEADAYAADMRAKGNVTCVKPQFEKPCRRGAT